MPVITRRVAQEFRAGGAPERRSQVVIQSAALSPAVVTCVAMSTQTHGAGPAATLRPRCSLLLVHGTADEVLSDACSRAVYRPATELKKLLLKDGAHHDLDEWADELPGILRQWLRDALVLGGPPHP